MRNTIQSLVLALAVLAAAAFTSKPAMAATTLHVPFSFMASGHSLPAGDYVVRASNPGGSVSLEGPKGKMFWLAGPGKPNPNDRRVILTFDKAVQGYLLRTVQYGSNITSQLDKPLLESIPAAQQIVGAQ